MAAQDATRRDPPPARTPFDARAALRSAEHPVSDDPVFDAAVGVVLAHEGGFQNDEGDPGNWTGGIVGAGALVGTKYGISAASYPNLDIANLSADEACAIYRRDWWDRLGLARLPAPLGAKLLDAAVNLGANPAIACLQRALRANGRSVAEGGVLGPETIAAAQAAPVEGVLAALREALAGHYRLIAARHPERERYLAGWLARAYS
ncbi:MAG: secretion activator protein [Alphaproteobacteria bacterium]|nr:secretion activator protein [Alphaproteobacteria bacterium]